MLQLEFFFIKRETLKLWDMQHLASLHTFVVCITTAID